MLEGDDVAPGYTPLIVNRIAATFPASMTPLTVLRSSGVTHFSHVVVMSSSSMPAACAIIGTVAPQAMISRSGISSSGVNSGERPMPISSS